MRIGIFGGTFDPIHLGHLILAEQCREQARLDQVWFVPAARPPNKLDRNLTSYLHRAEMLALAVAGHPAFRVEDLEKDRPGPSFTADTLDEIQNTHPDAELFLLLGSDSLKDLPHWYAPDRILRRAGLLVVTRPDHPIPPLATLQASIELPADVPFRCEVVAAPLIDIASRDVRRRVAEGHSVRYLVPRAVEAYLHDKHLYRDPPSP